MQKNIKYIFSFLSLLIIAVVLIFSKIVSQTVIEGIKICTNLLIPSLFIFLIISEFFYRTRALNYILKPFNIISEKLFKIDRKIAPIAFFSLICGYPSGANLITNLVQEKKISKQTATRMLYFCVNSGPAFLIGGVSVALSNKITFGLILPLKRIAIDFPLMISEPVHNSWNLLMEHRHIFLIILPEVHHVLLLFHLLSLYHNLLVMISIFL